MPILLSGSCRNHRHLILVEDRMWRLNCAACLVALRKTKVVFFFCASYSCDNDDLFLEGRIPNAYCVQISFGTEWSKIRNLKIPLGICWLSYVTEYWYLSLFFFSSLVRPTLVWPFSAKVGTCTICWKRTVLLWPCRLRSLLIFCVWNHFRVFFLLSPSSFYSILTKNNRQCGDIQGGFFYVCSRCSSSFCFHFIDGFMLASNIANTAIAFVSTNSCNFIYS